MDIVSVITRSGGGAGTVKHQHLVTVTGRSRFQRILLTPLLTTSLDTGVRRWKSINPKKPLNRHL